MLSASPTRESHANRSFCILGTAGHIDHGKSSLVKALTGTDPDRLPEEKARGMTIELGFAHMSVPSANEDGRITIGLVDVPGHERFIKTMVAGASGVDMAMLVIAADDGVMPQTREHVEILQLLGVSTGFVVISKSDLVKPDRIEVVRQQIAALLQGTPLCDWHIIEASTRIGLGLDEIRKEITRLAAGLAPGTNHEVFRLAIDRVFPIQGRGTVVTGSVLAGSIGPNTVLELLPGRIPCRVREIQSYGSAAAKVGPGQRAALNLTGIDREIINRGMELATPGFLTPSRYIDANFSVLARREKSVHSHQRVRVAMGTGEHAASLVVIGGGAVAPGIDAKIQLRLSEPVVAEFGQRFIIRSENADATLGGGTVIRPAAKRLHANNADTLNAARRAASLSPAERLEETLRSCEFTLPGSLQLSALSGIPNTEIQSMLESLRGAGVLMSVLPGVSVHRDTISTIERRGIAYLQRNHKTSPLEPGLLRDRFVGWLDKRSVPGLGKVICNRLEQAGDIVVRGPYVADREFRPAITPEDAAQLERIVGEITACGFDVPAWPALRALTGLSTQRAKLMDELARCDARLVLIAPGQYVGTKAVEKLKATVRQIGSGRKFKLAEVRDALQLSRRVVQPLLEHLDRVGFTRRVGDERVLTDKAQ